MSASDLHAITNDYQDARLLSLRKWRNAHEIEPRDPGGPYMVIQAGYDPQEISPVYDEFLLGRSGAWLPAGLFFRIPRDERRKEFVFGTAAEVADLLMGLVGKPRIVRKGDELAPPPAEEDDLAAAFIEAQDKAGASEKSKPGA